AVTAVRDLYRVSVADHRAPARLQEQVRHAAVLAPLTSRLGDLVGRARFVHVRVEVDGRVQDLAGIHDRRQRAQGLRLVDESRAVRAVERARADDVIHDLVEPALQPVLVAADEPEHVVRHRNLDVRGIELERGVRRVELDDEPVAQHDADGRPAVDLERAELERLGDGLPARGLRDGRAAEDGEHGHHRPNLPEKRAGSHGPPPEAYPYSRVYSPKEKWCQTPFFEKLVSDTNFPEIGVRHQFL